MQGFKTNCTQMLTPIEVGGQYVIDIFDSKRHHGICCRPDRKINQGTWTGFCFRDKNNYCFMSKINGVA